MRSFFPSLNMPTACSLRSFLTAITSFRHHTVRVAHYFIPQAAFHIVLHFLSPTQVKRCSSIVPFCSAKTYLQGCNKLPTVALAYSVHLPVGLCSSRCSPPAVYLFCFTHFPQSSLAAISSPQTPIKCSLYSLIK